MAPSKKVSSSLYPKGLKVRSRSTLASTSATDQPSFAESHPIISSFSPDGTLYAFVILSVDKHRLRVYNTASGRAIGEHTIESGHVSALTWSTVPQLPLESNSPSRKRKKTTAESIPEAKGKQKDEEAVVLGLSEGSVLFFSPTQSKVVYVLVHPTSTSAILSVAVGHTDKSLIWTSSIDSSIRLWNVQKNSILKSWKSDDRIPCSALAVRPVDDDSQGELLIAHHHIRLLTDVSTSGESIFSKPRPLGDFTGHASSVKTLIWDESATRFFSTAEGDRFIYIWDVEDTSHKPVASISLDSTVQSIAITPSSDSSPATLIALSASGKLSFVPLPQSLLALSSSGERAQKVHTLIPRSSFSSVSKTRPLDPPVIDFVSIPGNPSTLRLARLLKGTQPVFDALPFVDDLGSHIQDLSLRDLADISKHEQVQSAPNKRYVEPKSVGLGSGLDIDQGEKPDGQQDVNGDLQLDLAELSLGQRLSAVTESRLNIGSDSEGDHAAKKASQHTKSAKKSSRDETSMIPVNSLTRTLIQALHSSDSRLLEMCLAHSEPMLIRNTVRRLPPQMAVPLITACVERLGRGPRAANMKGTAGGASSQRGSGLLTWLTTVLAVHTGHLMTIPGLVARLSGLHATLIARLSLHENLLTLSGRLDMVLSQVELRASGAPTSLSSSVGRAEQTKKDSDVFKRYIEGDTDSDDGAVEVEVDNDDEGSIEDVELGGASDDDEEEEEEEDLSDSDGGYSTDFIDDEAADDFSEEDSDSESE